MDDNTKFSIREYREMLYSEITKKRKVSAQPESKPDVEAKRAEEYRKQQDEMRKME